MAILCSSSQPWHVNCLWISLPIACLFSSNWNVTCVIHDKFDAINLLAIHLWDWNTHEKKRRHKIKTTTKKKHVFFLTPSIYKCKISNHDKCVNTPRKSKWSLRINNYINHENHIQILVDWSHSIRLAIDFPSHFNAISFIFISIFVAFAGIVLPRDIFNNSRLK